MIIVNVDLPTACPILAPHPLDRFCLSSKLASFLSLKWVLRTDRHFQIDLVFTHVSSDMLLTSVWFSELTPNVEDSRTSYGSSNKNSRSHWFMNFQQSQMLPKVVCPLVYPTGVKFNQQMLS